jgi:hypothetical protein
MYLMRLMLILMINGCDKFFGVVSKDKQSFIGEIDKELAYETIHI